MPQVRLSMKTRMMASSCRAAAIGLPLCRKMGLPLRARWHAARRSYHTVAAAPQSMHGPLQAVGDSYGAHAGATSSLRLHSQQQFQVQDSIPKAPSPPVKAPHSQVTVSIDSSIANFAISYTTTILPLCTVQEIQTLLKSLEVPDYTLRAFKDQGVTGSDLCMMGWRDLVHDTRMRLPPVVARKILRVPLAWQLLCVLSGSDARFALDLHQLLAALTQAGLVEHPRCSAHASTTPAQPGMPALPHSSQPHSPSLPVAAPVPPADAVHPSCPLPNNNLLRSQQQHGSDPALPEGSKPTVDEGVSVTVAEAAVMHRPLRGLTRIRVLFATLDTDRDGILTIEDIARALPLIAQVLMEEMWVSDNDTYDGWEGGLAPPRTYIPDPVLRCRLQDICERVERLSSNQNSISRTPEPEQP